MATPRSFADLFNWLVSVLPDAFKRAGLSGGGTVTGTGTTGAIPKWTSASALGDSGASMDGSNRLAVPVGIAFPGGSTLDAAPISGPTGSGSTGQVAYWSASSVLAGLASFTLNPSTGAVGVASLASAGAVTGTTITGSGQVTGDSLAISNNTGAIIDSSGTTRIAIARGGTPANTYTSPIGAGGNAHQFIADNVTDAGTILSCKVAGTIKASITGAGKLTQQASDTTGSPGSASVNKPTGKSAIAASATSATITNTLVSSSSEIFITPIDIDTPAKWKAVPASGSFTITVDAAPASAWRFSWWVLN